MAYCITKSMGMDRIKARVPEWLAAMRAGAAAAPKCVGTNAAGEPCRLHRMRGADRCHIHLHGKARDALDDARLARAHRLSRSTNAQHRSAAEATIAAIARRRLHRAWKIDATLPGSTLALPDNDEASVRRWLLDTHRIDLDQEPCATHANTDHPITARCIDRLRWAATLHLAGRMGADGAARRVFVAMRDDLKFWAKRHGEPAP